MAGTTTTPSGPTHIAESYCAVENRITEPAVPLTIRSLKLKADQRWAAIPEECGPTFRQRLHDPIFGSLTQAQDGAQAIGDLGYTEAVQKARKARRTGSHRPLGKGGILLALEAI